VANENECISYRARPTVVSVRHGDATVLLDASTGRYYTLNEVGTFIWDQVCEAEPVSAIRDALCSNYDVPADHAQEDVLAFIRSLAKRDLLTGTPDERLDTQ